MINFDKKILKVLVIFILGLLTLTVEAQSVNEVAARAELQKRGYDETRFREELLKKGVNVDNIDPKNPVEVARAQKAVEEVMAILEAEKTAATSAPAASTPSIKGSATPPSSKLDDTRSVDAPASVVNQSKEIQKAVKEGATIEEAVSESLQEANKTKLPTAITYGQHIFRDKSLKLFRTAEDAKPSKSYILGPGDKVAISIWGPSDVNYALEIEKDGYIQPTNQPRYYIAGLTVEAAEKLMASKLKNYHYFNKENFELAVVTSRTININIVGEVFNNGTFNISAINTAFNALIAAGGPNDIGTVRKIQVLRAGQKPKILDVYKYLQNPNLSQEFYLADNDFINVPVAQKLVTISGAVNRAFRYEMIDNEGLKELIDYAGGFKANALKGNLQIKRIENDSVRIIDLNYAAITTGSKSIQLINGDEVIVLEVDNRIRNEVSISGAVESPGKYALAAGDKISDLLRKSVLQPQAITDNAYLKRFNEDYKTMRYQLVNIADINTNPSSKSNILLRPGDELIVSAKSDFTQNYKAKVEGAVRTPIEIPLDDKDNLRISDLVFLANGLQQDAMDFAYVFRSTGFDTTTQEYLYINIKEAINNPSSAANILLEPNDRLVVYAKSTYSDESFVRIAGAVRSPGEFLYNPTLTLRDLLLLAGGLQREASLDRIDIYRLSFEGEKTTRVLAAKLKINEDFSLKQGGDTFTIEPFDQVYVRQAPDFELQRNINIIGEVKYPGTYVLMSSNTKLSTIINDAGGANREAFLKGATLKRMFDNVGYVVIDLEKAIADPNSFENIILQEGDEISIPKTSNLVAISGATHASEIYKDELLSQPKIQVPYRQGKDAKYYIDSYAGGLAKEASINKISVRDASGKITKAKSFLFFKSYPKVGPGAEILVGYKDEKVKSEKLGKDDGEVKWGEVLASSIAQATAILSIILLVQNVN